MEPRTSPLRTPVVLSAAAMCVAGCAARSSEGRNDNRRIELVASGIGLGAPKH